MLHIPLRITQRIYIYIYVYYLIKTLLWWARRHDRAITASRSKIGVESDEGAGQTDRRRYWVCLLLRSPEDRCPSTLSFHCDPFCVNECVSIYVYIVCRESVELSISASVCVRGSRWQQWPLPLKPWKVTDIRGCNVCTTPMCVLPCGTGTIWLKKHCMYSW